MLAFLTVAIVFFQFCFIAGLDRMSAGNVKVTVAFFSGRNDPEWSVQPNRELKQLLSVARKKGFTYPPDTMPVRLGYRGILVEDTSTKTEELIVGPETMELQQRLISTIPKRLLLSGDLEEIEKDIGSGKIKAVKPDIYQVRGKRYAPPYAPQTWNAIEPVYKRRRCNNCYNYANRKATDTRAQPGYGGGQEYTQYTAANLIAAAQRDNLVQLNPHPTLIQPVPGPPNDMSKHMVALVIRPITLGNSGDHHWYRLDNNGRWSHKPGQNFVTQNDNANQPILDPRAANIGTYQFARFMVSDPLTVQIGSAWQCPV